jgi:hypothetical protein
MRTQGIGGGDGLTSIPASSPPCHERRRPVRRSALDRPRVLNGAGERLIRDAFERRSRKHASWGDCAEIVVLTLEATGLLGLYAELGIDPLETIQAFNQDAGSQ